MAKHLFRANVLNHLGMFKTTCITIVPRRYIYNNLNYRTRILDYNSAVYDRNNIQVLNIQSYVDNDVVSIKVLYRLVYWTTQLLTWLLIPFLSAYVQGNAQMTHISKAFFIS